MRETRELDRRTFLKGAGAAAVLGAVTAPRLTAESALVGAPPPAPQQAFDFDAIYDRVGTNCTKWDGAIATFGDGIEVGMGVADMDFQAAPCITRALAERCRHENWGYLRRPDSYAAAVADWNRRRYGLEIDPASLVFTTGVHPGLVAALQTFAPPGSRVLLTSPVYTCASPGPFLKTVP
jgi:bifunctional pyridoxal-dependent enzyme with beta-cystathionase and maltose regulon repressor activities